jgi:hypothetical protein
VPIPEASTSGGSVIKRSLAIAALALVAAAGLPAAADGSQLLARNAQGVKLAVDAHGRALVTYREAGSARHAVAWGAVNGIALGDAGGDIRFRLDYSGGWATWRKELWRGFPNACRAYDGPPLAWLVRACKAPDGSYWALQSWQRMLPNYGERPTGRQGARELRLSHWRGELARLEIELDWAYGRFDHLFGRFTYRGVPVHGNRVTAAGSPLDGFGRNIYLDTFESAYGAGWHRENSFLTHRGSGAFCYGVFPHAGGPAGKGARYRATVIGPGVTPDVMWQGDAPGSYDGRLDSLANERIRSLGASKCQPN